MGRKIQLQGGPAGPARSEDSSKKGRRSFLARGAAIVGSAAAGVAARTAQAAESALPDVPKWMQTPGAAMRGYDLVMTANQWGAPETFEEPQAIFHFLGKASLSMPFNVTGQPAATVCCGFDSEGLPLAFQLAGRAFDEAGILAAGHAFQQATDWHMRRPPL